MSHSNSNQKSLINPKIQKTAKNAVEIKSPTILTNPIQIVKRFKKDFGESNELNRLKIIEMVAEFAHDYKKKKLMESIDQFIKEQIKYYQDCILDMDVNTSIQISTKNDKDEVLNLVNGQLINPEIKFVSKTLGDRCKCKLEVHFKHFGYYFECYGNYKNFLNVDTDYLFDNGVFNEQEIQILSNVFDSHIIEQESTQWMLEYNKTLLIDDEIKLFN